MESEAKDNGHSSLQRTKAKKYWKILRYAILTEYEENAVSKLERALPELIFQKKQRKYAEERKRLQVNWEKALEAAKNVLATAELNAEHANTKYQTVLVNKKRRQTICDHSKVIDDIFRNNQSANNNNDQASNYVANGIRHIRKIEAECDRMQARERFLGKLKNKKHVKKKNDETRESKTSSSPEKDEQEAKAKENDEETKTKETIRKNSKKKINKKYDKQKAAENTNNTNKAACNFENQERTNKSKFITNETKNEENSVLAQDTENEFHLGYNAFDDDAGKETMHHRKERNKRKAPFYLFHPVELQKLQSYPEEDEKEQSLKLPILTGNAADKRTGVSYEDSCDKRIKFTDINTTSESEDEISSNKSIKFPKLVEKKNKISSMGMEIGQSDYIRCNDSPRHSNWQREKAMSYQDYLRKTIKEQKDSSGETSRCTSISSTSPIKKLSEQSFNSSEATVSFTALALQNWHANRKFARNANEIINGLREFGLYAQADELEENLFAIHDKQFNLRKSLNEARKHAELAKQRTIECEKEKARIHKVRLAYRKYKRLEEKRQEREALKRELREKQEKRLEANRKLHDERLKLTIANSISRQHSFSYFSGIITKSSCQEENPRQTPLIK